MTDKPEITTEQILGSSAWRLLTRLIDQKARYLQDIINRFPEMVKTQYAPENHRYKATVDTKVWEEQDDNIAGDGELPIDISAGEFERFRYYLDEAQKLDKEISVLRRLKLELLNDWDFTKGDDSLQRYVILGEPLKEPE